MEALCVPTENHKQKSVTLHLYTVLLILILLHKYWDWGVSQASFCTHTYMHTYTYSLLSTAAFGTYSASKIYDLSFTFHRFPQKFDWVEKGVYI